MREMKLLKVDHFKVELNPCHEVTYDATFASLPKLNSLSEQYFSAVLHVFLITSGAGCHSGGLASKPMHTGEALISPTPRWLNQDAASPKSEMAR